LAYPITVITHTWNEERDIEECLLSARDWADEIIVADMESKDRTVEIAEKYADQILSFPFAQVPEPARNASLAAARNEWALYLDADERLTPEIKKIIEQAIEKHGHEAAAVQLPYKNFVFGKWIRHAGGWWPGYKAPLLVRKGKIEFPPHVHAVPKLDGSLVRITPGNDREAIEHYTYRGVRDWIEKANRYTSLEAELYEGRNVAIDWRQAAEAFGSQLNRYYDETNGKADGIEGWLLSVCCSVYELFNHVKYWERMKDHPGAMACMPPSAAEFMAVAARAAGASMETAVPKWLGQLTAMLGAQDAVTHWRAEDLGSDGLSRLAKDTRDGTLMLLGFPPTSDTESFRNGLETLFDATVHLIDPAPNTSRLVAMFWKGQEIAARRRVLITVHKGALEMMGGGEVVVFRTLLEAARGQGVVADVTSGMRLSPEPYDLVHVVSLFQAENAPIIEGWGKPVVVTPIYWDGPRVDWVSRVLPHLMSVDITPEELEQVLGLYARRELGANEVKLEDTEWPPESREALARVRDIGRRVVATGPQEISEMERALGSSSIPVSSVHLGVDTSLFENATPNLFVEQFRLRDFVLCAGRVEPMKNQLMLAYALRGTGTKLVLIGGASDAAYLELTKKWGGEDLIYVGPQPPEMVASAMKAAACHALPSWWEVPGLVSVEAAAAGCHVVATDCGTIRHYLGDNAFYCDPADPASIRDAVLSAASSCESLSPPPAMPAHADIDPSSPRGREGWGPFTHEQSAAGFAAEYEAALGVRLLLIPDWPDPSTWQPVFEAYMNRYGDGSGVTLCMLTSEPTGADACQAEAALREFCDARGIDPETTPDVELVDVTSAGTVGAILRTGSKAEAALQEQLGFAAIEWRETFAKAS